jgi:hypothetical protein
VALSKWADGNVNLAASLVSGAGKNSYRNFLRDLHKWEAFTAEREIRPVFATVRRRWFVSLVKDIDHRFL